MIFIGAGVPVAFGIAPLIEMTKIIRDKITKENQTYVDQINQVIERLEANGFVGDIENVLSVLEAMKNPERVYAEIGPKVAALEVAGTLAPMVDIDPLIKSIKLNIKQLCSSPDYDKATAFYNPLLKQLSKMTHIGTEAEEAKRFKSMIVTANYDITIEETLEARGTNYYDGFSFNEARKIPVFSKSWPQISGLPGSINLVKIHGSVDYYLEQEGIIVKDRAITKLGRDKKRSELLVYPAGEKSITSTPYYDLYSIFRTELFLGKFMICLGFSFRDFAIRNIVSDWLSINSNAKLILYARHADANRSQFPSEFQSRIITENVDFTASTPISDITTHLHY